jgi:hypothetical protein
MDRINDFFDYDFIEIKFVAVHSVNGNKLNEFQ